jgi:hypothetical protein
MYAMQSHVLVGQYTMLHLMRYFHQLHRVEEYKNLLFKKLKDNLEITGFNMNDLKQQELSKLTATIPISQEVGISK